LGALLLVSCLFTGHKLNMTPLPSKVQPAALLLP
jgi:hypothetical protein